MSYSQKILQPERQERRLHWRDRRGNAERRNQQRVMHSTDECRSNIPRRNSDISGHLAEGIVWWKRNN